MTDGPRRRLVLAEPSKVRHYHSTLMDGFIRAFSAEGGAVRHGAPRLFAHPSFFATLSTEAREAVRFTPVPVMDQDKRRLLRKALLEFWVTARLMLRLHRDETMLVSTLMPPAMILLELLAWVLPRRDVVVMQHGELEGAFEKDRQRLGSFGFYILIWLRLRRIGTKLKVAVLDEFIASAVRTHFRDAIRDEDLYVIPLPMTPMTAAERRPGTARCCFIGFDTKNKGGDTYARLAAAHPELEFRAVGGGVDRRVGEEGGRPLASSEAFLAAVADCDIAVLPYTGGYSCSLSAAATDAVAAGLHLLTSDRACFHSLADAFGPDLVTVCDTVEQMEACLGDPAWVERAVSGRADRLERVERSRYGRRGVAAALDRILEGGGSIRTVHAPRASASVASGR